MILSPLDSRALILPGVLEVTVNRGITPVSGIIPVSWEPPAGTAQDLGDVFVAVDGVLKATILNVLGRACLIDVGSATPGDHTVDVYLGARDWVESGLFYHGSAVYNNYSYPNLGVRLAGGSNDYCQLQDAAFAPTGSGFSVAFWFKVNVDTGVVALASLHKTSDGSSGWIAQWTSGDGARFAYINFGGTQYNSPFGTAAVGDWHLFIGTCSDSGTDALNLPYLSFDGAARSAGTHATGGADTAASATLALGRNAITGGSEPTADFDELMYWNRELTDAECALVWNGGIGINHHDLINDPALASLLTGLVGAWDCDDTAGDNLADATTGGRNLLGQNSTSTYTSVAGIR